MKVLGIAILLVIGLFFNNIRVSAQTVTLTPRYIQKIHLQNPERALHLLDSVEQNHLPGIQPYETDMLRSMCYEVLVFFPFIIDVVMFFNIFPALSFSPFGV